MVNALDPDLLSYQNSCDSTTSRSNKIVNETLKRTFTIQSNLHIWKTSAQSCEKKIFTIMPIVLIFAFLTLWKKYTYASVQNEIIVFIHKHCNKLWRQLDEFLAGCPLFKVDLHFLKLGYLRFWQRNVYLSEHMHREKHALVGEISFVLAACIPSLDPLFLAYPAFFSSV